MDPSLGAFSFPEIQAGYFAKRSAVPFSAERATTSRSRGLKRVQYWAVLRILHRPVLDPPAYSSGSSRLADLS